MTPIYCSCTAVHPSGGTMSNLTINQSQLGLVTVSLIPVLAVSCSRSLITSSVQSAGGIVHPKDGYDTALLKTSN